MGTSIVYDLDELEPLQFEPTLVSNLLRDQRQLVLASRPPIARLVLPPALAQGVHAGYQLREADELDEVLLVADGSDPNVAAYLVYVWRPRLGQVEVLPQRWFTARDFDLGYEWITRVARDPKTGRLIGDGTRIAPFELDRSGMRPAKSSPIARLFSR
jgi:hypothetical protein